ncbi:MAG: hypothetical protein IH987_16075 [Planctomycetes bacterium]|nr:hypothetical protein [Planctomycetota bacterium]
MMVHRLLISILTLASCGILAAYSVSAAPPDVDKCVFPDDCLRHRDSGINISWGVCECRSAWKARYIHSKGDEHLRMWRERRMPLADRILDAYRLTEAQKETCNAIRDEVWADWGRRMGKQQFDEIVGLQEDAFDRLREHLDVIRRASDGAPGAAEARAKLPRVRDDPELQRLKQRSDEIYEDHPIDWSDLADRIEDALPKEQAKRGRERLAERFPYSVSGTHGEKLGSGKAKTGAAAGDMDRWGAYVRAFTTRYQLTPAQSNAAKSILEEVRAQAGKLTRAMGDEVARYQAGGHQEEARRRREVLQFDLDDLFDGFQTRLDALLTTSQQQQSTSAEPGEKDARKDRAPKEANGS